MTLLTILMSLSQQHVWLILSSIFICYCLGLVFYRLFLHPLAHIPGPRLAAATRWYEFYYDVIQKGQYQAQLSGFHEKYGPIIRITPNELHCNDPEMIDQIYAGAGSGKKRDKTLFFCNGFQFWGSGLNTMPHSLHRLRRSTLNPFFSRGRVASLEQIVKDYLENTCRGLNTYAGTKLPVNVQYAFGCMTTDIITQYCFGWSENYSSNRAFTPNLIEALTALQKMIHIQKHFPVIGPMVRTLPHSWVEKIMPDAATWNMTERRICQTVDDVMQAEARRETKIAMEGSIFEAILTGDYPPQEKTRFRLVDEAKVLIGAGTATTAWALSIATYYLLNNPDTLEKLSEELRQNWENPEEIPSWLALEKLPYLSATINESLRFSCGLSTRLPRIPHGSLHYTSTFRGKQVQLDIPGMTPIAMTTGLVHFDPRIFPEPEKFRPERWLDENGNRNREPEKYLLAFSKGTRQCLGINLAGAELTLGLATFIRRFGDRIELFETGPKEVEWSYDLLEPGRESYAGVRVLVK